MGWIAALFLMGFSWGNGNSYAQDTLETWAKKVIELQSKEGQNFEQDLQLAKGYLFLQRRNEAQDLLNRMIKSYGKITPRLKELRETALDQFFHQESAENYAQAVQLIRSENHPEARDLILSTLSKEKRNRLLILRAIQLHLALKRWDEAEEQLNQAEMIFPESNPLKVYRAWWYFQKGDSKSTYRILSALWGSDHQIFEQSEPAVLLFFQAMYSLKKFTEEPPLLRLVSKHPEWIAVRVWRWVNANLKKSESEPELRKLKEFFEGESRFAELREKEDRQSLYYYRGLISLNQFKKTLDERLGPKTGKNQ